MRNVMLVPQQFCPMEWPSVYNMLEPAVSRSHGRWTMTSLLTALCMGQQNLWLVKEDDVLKGAFCTQVVQYPERKLVAIQFLGGTDFAEWADDALSMVEKYAEHMGCQGVEAVARFGFWPFFKKRKYDRSYCTYECDFLEDKDHG